MHVEIMDVTSDLIDNKLREQSTACHTGVPRVPRHAIADKAIYHAFFLVILDPTHMIDQLRCIKTLHTGAMVVSRSIKNKSLN